MSGDLLRRLLGIVLSYWLRHRRRGRHEQRGRHYRGDGHARQTDNVQSNETRPDQRDLPANVQSRRRSVSD